MKAGTQWVSLNSQLPNRLAAQGVRDGVILLPDFPPPFTVKREVTAGDSRIDIAAVKPDGETFYLEVKGVTLVREGIAQFPDAPTDRGVKHLHELTRIARKGERPGCCSLSSDRTPFLSPQTPTGRSLPPPSGRRRGRGWPSSPGNAGWMRTGSGWNGRWTLYYKTRTVDKMINESGIINIE